MKWSFLVAFLGLFPGAGLVFGQPSETPSWPHPAEVPCGAVTKAPCLPMIGAAGLGGQGFFTTDVDYLLWFVKSENLPIDLGTTDPLLRIPGNVGLEVRQERTRLSGARFTVGYWLADDSDPVLPPGPTLASMGIEASGFFLGERSANFLSGSAPALLRPFFNANDLVPSAVVVAFPGLASGQLSGSVRLDLWGAELNGWVNAFSNPPGQTVRFDLMAGARYLDLEGDVRIGRTSVFQPNLAVFPAFLPLAGSRVEEFEAFSTQNQFYGGQVGARARFILDDCAELDLTVKYALGNTQQQISIDGGQRVTAPNGTQTASPGALLALPSNIGVFTRNRFTQVPEAGVTVRLNLTERLCLHAGYTFFYWNRVVRAGDQIDRVIDISQVPNFPGAAAAVPTGLGRPAVPFQENSLLVHGLNVGLKYAW